MKEYLEIAIEQFYEMKEEWLDDDRHCIGGENEKEYDVKGVKIKVKVDGFWEKSDWFNYVVFDCNGNELNKGHWI